LRGYNIPKLGLKGKKNKELMISAYIEANARPVVPPPVKMLYQQTAHMHDLTYQ
jgi:hypothetical protein